MSSTPPPPGSVPAGPPAGDLPRGTVPRTLDEVWYKPGLNILLAIVTLGVWTWLWTYHTTEDLKRYNGDGLGGTISLVFAILINPVVWFTIPNEIEKMYKHDGRDSPISTLWGLWFLLPIIGNFIWYLKVQRTLNEFWLSKGTSMT
jgi:Domain of unknown function (DUF4234)